MDFFVEDSSQSVWHRIVASDIIMCQEDGRVVVVYRLNKPKVVCSESIDGFHIKYLKGNKKFIRSSSTDIINRDMVVCMVERAKAYILKMEGGLEASLRRGHDYAYEVRTNKTKPSDDELYKEDQEFIDKMILAYSDCNYISNVIFDKTGLRLNSRYIRERYKIIKNS